MKMKSLQIICIILIFYLKSNAQSTFNKVFYPSSTQKLITSVTVFDGKTIFVGIDVDSFQFVGNPVTTLLRYMSATFPEGVSELPSFQQ